MADTTFQSRNYFSRSWNMLTQDKGWWKPVLLLALAMVVPIIGPIAVVGYMYEWARLTAWNVDSAPKQKGVSIGGCIAAGWRVFVVVLGLGILIGIGIAIVTGILGAIFGYGILAWAVTLIGWAITIAGSLFIGVAALRATIYQKIGPGYGLSHVWKMFSHDIPGLLRILVIELIGVVATFVIVSVFSGIVASMLFSSVVPMLYGYGYYGYGYGEYYLIQTVLNALAGAGPAFLIVCYLSNIVTTVFGLLTTNALGLWIRQFDVPNWGDAHDELPDALPAGPAPATEPVNPAQSGSVAPVVPAAPVAAVKSETQEEGTVQYPNEDVDAGKVSDLHPTAPTQKELYETAPDAITEWTSIVEPEVNATDHVQYKPEPTEKPVEQGTDGFPSQADVYGTASENVAAWPQVDLEATNALEAKAEQEKMEGAQNQVFDDPITVPSEKDIYEDAAEGITSWTSVVEPETSATDHMPWKPEETEKPVEQGTDGFPSEEDIYEVAAGKVADWPENALDDSKVVAEEQLLEDDVKFDKPDGSKSE